MRQTEMRKHEMLGVVKQADDCVCEVPASTSLQLYTFAALLSVC